MTPYGDMELGQHLLDAVRQHGILIHWGRVMHICISKQTILGSDNGSLPGRHQAIISTNAGKVLIGP